MDSYDVGGTEILLVRLDGRFHAYRGACPHQSQPLVEGVLDGGTLTCQAHEWTFDLRTGLGINPRGSCLTRHEVSVVDGMVLVSRAPAAH
jgi:toluene monooxygenase system ferredoxin subunit